MFLLVWEDKLKTGISLIDEQHQAIISAVNMFYMRAERKPDYYDTLDMLATLMQYASVHFQLEEAYMINEHFPDVQSHKATHKWMGFQLKRFSTMFNETVDDRIVDEMLSFIKDSFITHISEEDIRFADFLKTKSEGRTG